MLHELFGKAKRILTSWDALAVLLLAIGLLLCYLPVTLGQRAFIEGDILYSSLPIRTELSRALAEGRLPLWTPGLEADFSLFAEGEIAALYPLNLLLHRLLPPPIAVSYTILFNLIWASVGIYAYCRSSGLRVPSAALAGCVLGAGGFMTAQVSQVPHLTVAAWLPWLLLFQHKHWRARFAAKPFGGWFLLIGFAIAFQFLAALPR